MNKTELASAIAAKCNLTKKDAEAAIAAFTAVVSETLQKGEKVQLVGFGTFEPKDRPARTCRNPRSGETIEVAASRQPVFKPGKALKDALN